MRDAGGCASCSCPEEVPADLQRGFGGLVAWGGDGSSWQRCFIWWKLISPRIRRKPEDVIEFPIIVPLVTAPVNISGPFLPDLFLHEGLFFVLCLGVSFSRG